MSLGIEVSAAKIHCRTGKAHLKWTIHIDRKWSINIDAMRSSSISKFFSVYVVHKHIFNSYSNNILSCTKLSLFSIFIKFNFTNNRTADIVVFTMVGSLLVQLKLINRGKDLMAMVNSL
jgi:hypothetical protein